MRHSSVLTLSAYGLPPLTLVGAVVVACSSRPTPVERAEAPIVEAGPVTVPNVCGTDPTAPAPISSPETLAGYVDAKSYYPSDVVGLRLSANPAVVGGSVEVFRFVGTAAGYHAASGMEAKGTVLSSLSITTKTIPGNASHCGAGWSNTGQFTIPADWKSGLYAAKVNGGGASIWIPFVVKATVPKGLLIVAATNTWEAYNDWPLRLTSSECTSDATCGGTTCKKLVGETYGFCVPSTRPATDWWGAHSYYAPTTAQTPATIGAFPSGAGVSIGAPVLAGDNRGKVVSFQRPNPWGANPFPTLIDGGMRPAVPSERDLVDWLGRNDAAIRRASEVDTYSMIADSDSGVVSTLDPKTTYAVVLAGHSEYWTADMLGAVDRFVHRGGHLLNLSGNTSLWRVTYDTNGGMFTSRGTATQDWQPYGDIATTFRAAHQSDALGISYRGGNGTNGSFTRAGYGAHWLMSGTGTAAFGLASKWLNETANRDIAVYPPGFQAGCGLSNCTGASWELDAIPDDGVIEDVSTLRLAHASTGSGGQISYLGRPHGGGIFNANAITFTQSLAAVTPGGLPADPQSTQLVLNAIKRFQRPLPSIPADFTGSPLLYTGLNGTSDFLCAIPGGHGAANEGGSKVAPMPPGSGTPTLWAPAGWCTWGDVRTGDLDGDGRVDLFCAEGWNGTVRWARSDGTQFVPQPTPAATNVWCSGANVYLGFADVTGDGKADLICHNGTGIAPWAGWTWVAKANAAGTGFDAGTSWTDALGNHWCYWAGSQFGVADFDGDGRADIYCHDSGGTTEPSATGKTWVALSNGVNGFVDPYGSEWLTGWCHGASDLTFGATDLNGDSVADLFCHQTGTGKTWVHLGEGARSWSGSAFGAGFRRAGTDPAGLVQSGWCSGNRFGMTDVDGDGRADAWCQIGPSVYYAKARPVVPASGPVTWGFEATALAAASFCGTSSTYFDVHSAR